MSRVAAQIKQLAINFNGEAIGKLKEVVHCQVVDGVEIDESELASMEEMMREASSEPSIPINSARSTSTITEAPLTRNSVVFLQGDENDLLSESPVFQKAKVEEIPASLVRNAPRNSLEPIQIEEPLDDHLINEINDYLQGIMNAGD